jgi:aspartyl-tRNA(Asn)/glutamyl-tRNA(Gln) amidotransferase subunit B
MRSCFPGHATTFGADPNCNVSLVDAAMPGMLPVINRFCVEQAIRTGLGLKAEINHYSRFDRKNYFYPDLPQGYQISQFAHPIVGEGEIEVDVEPAHGGEAYSSHAGSSACTWNRMPASPSTTWTRTPPMWT